MAGGSGGGAATPSASPEGKQTETVHQRLVREARERCEARVVGVGPGAFARAKPGPVKTPARAALEAVDELSDVLKEALVEIERRLKALEDRAETRAIDPAALLESLAEDLEEFEEFEGFKESAAKEAAWAAWMAGGRFAACSDHVREARFEKWWAERRFEKWWAERGGE